MTVIELGFITADGDQEPEPRGPSRRGRHDLRRMLVALVAVCCVLTVTGSARPDPRGLPQLWSIPFHQDGDTFSVTGDAVFVLSRGEDTISAYSLRTGARQWAIPAFSDTIWLGWVTAGVLLLPAGDTTIRFTAEDGSEVARQVTLETIAIDAATGRQLWRQPGEFTVLSDDRLLLAEWNDKASAVRSLRAVRVRDGGTIWSHSAEALTSWTTGSGTDGAPADRLVAITSDRSVKVLDVADGAVVTSGRMPWGQHPDYTDATLTLQGHRIYADQIVGGKPTIAAYETETLRQLWLLEPEEPGGAFPCGPLLCLNGPDSTAGYDRETGELRWRLAGLRNGYPLPGDRILVDDDNTGARHRLVDAASGRVLTDIEAATPVWDYRTGETPYLLARTREPADLTSVSSFDARTGETLLRGAIAAVDPGCQSKDGLLLCVTLDQQLTVTDVG